ncbi:hypothetical protein, partial [Achromobacter insuavis]|uniref:hypothetical protein n=1 Tax=Achromobacter insuavis TaxID=1287735 RepID=UPI001EEE2059
PQAGRAGGLLRLTRCLAIRDGAIACGNGEIIFFGRLAAAANDFSLKACQRRNALLPRPTCAKTLCH